MTEPTHPGLRFSFRIVADVDHPIPLEKRDAEELVYLPIVGGTVEGDLVGEVLTGGADWARVRADETFALEARYLFRTSESEVVDVVNVGYLRHDEGRNGPMEEMTYFRCTPRFRTAAPRLQWLTRSVFVASARTFVTRSVIDVYEVL